MTKQLIIDYKAYVRFVIISFLLCSATKLLKSPRNKKKNLKSLVLYEDPLQTHMIRPNPY